MKCDIGIIKTPVYQPFTVSITNELTFFANPDFELTVKLITGSTGLSFDPSNTLTFSPTKNSANIFITGKMVGIYTIIYEIGGKSSLQFQQPEPDTLIVQPVTLNPPEYFTSRGLEPGMLEPGSCASATPLDYTCPKGSNEQISFSSTCRWYDNTSPGLIFSGYKGLNLPVAIAGTKISNTTTADQSRIMPLMGDDFLKECNYASPQSSCDFKPSDLVNEIENFLSTEALSNTYISQTEQLIPQWLQLSVNTNTSRTHDSNSYMVDLVESSYLSDSEECSDLFTIEDGMYSVLKYAGSFNFKINSSLQSFIPQELPVCFAVNLCEGLNSPLSITIPNEAQIIVNALPFAQIIRNYGWQFIINSIAISSTPFTHKLSGFTDEYLFGNQEIIYTFPNSTVIAEGRFNHSFSMDTLQVDFSLDGHTYMLYNNFDKVDSHCRQITLFYY